MAGKRVFPPEWYAAQAARRKQRAEAKASSSAPNSSSSRSAANSSRKDRSLQNVRLYTRGASDSGVGANFTRTRGNSTRSADYSLRRKPGDKGVSQYSMDRLRRVLEARRKDSEGRVSSRKSKTSLNLQEQVIGPQD